MQFEERHDYLIVGAGTSGITLGYLLERQGKDVVVLEAGEDKDDDPNIHNFKSFYGLEAIYRNEYFWPENGKPNPRLTSDENHHSGGRLWGGSSSINEAWYWRGTQTTYDQWGGLFADSSFCRDAFRKIETFHGVSQNPEARGDHGPIDVTQSPAYPIGERFISALHVVLREQYGIDVPVVDDIHTVNGPALSVRSQHFVNPDDKKRVSTSISLIKKRKSGLDIRSQSTVVKVLFEGAKAVGVRYLHQGESRTIAVDKKVIVCSGPRSSCILMHSGIWDEHLLRQLGIPVVYHNPAVGRNLSNHLSVLIGMKVPPEDNKEVSEALWFKGFTAVGAIPDTMNADRSQIDLEMFTLSRKPGEASVVCFLLSPDSTGHIAICSSDPLHPIVVESNYLSVPKDGSKLERALEVIERVIDRLSATYEGYELTTDLSDKNTYIRNNAAHAHHWTGTCQIGKVLDEHLNVLGVENLMVADTSSIPGIFRGHTCAAALLIGAAAFVELTGIKDWDF
ncbi:MAG: GMC family oxidoreductase [Arenicellales bacterium]